jgi:DNA-binding response OmpR family regulator
MPNYTLIIDDDPETCRMLGATLRAIGIESRPAYDGEQAFRLIQEDLPELIILDLMLPGMSGFDIFRRLRADPLTLSLPIIVVSAHIDEHTRDELPGVEHFLLKGKYRIAELRELVAAAIGRRDA